MNDELIEKYTKSYGIINRMIIRKVTISERKELQKMLKFLIDSKEIDEKDRENFLYWFNWYERDIEQITRDINVKIQNEKAIIELAEKRIEKLKEKLL